MLIGGYAVGFHGYPRATNDMDIFVAGDKENAQLIIKSLIEFGFSSDEISEKIFTDEKSIVRMGVRADENRSMLHFISGIEV